MEFDEWLAKKDEEKAEADFKAAEARRAATEERLRKAARDEKAFLGFLAAQQRDRAFGQLQYLHPRRAQSTAEWAAIGRALAHVQLHLALVGVAEPGADDTFLRWSKAKHVFDEVIVPAAMVPKFSKGALASMADRAPDSATSGASAGAAATAAGSSSSTGVASGPVKVVSGLKYILPPKPPQVKPGTPRPLPVPLSPDELQHNKLFVGAVKTAWKEALAAAEVAAAAAVAVTVDKPGGGGSAAGGAGAASAPPTGILAPAGARLTTTTTTTAPSGPGTASSILPPAIAARVAHHAAHGVEELLRVAAADKAAADAAKRRASEEKRAEGASAHSKWLKTKHAVRIRIPSPDAHPLKEASHPRMDFSHGDASGRVHVARPPIRSSSADIMRRSGMHAQFAHATGRPDTAAADLAASRKSLLAEGLVFRENFDDASAYERERAANKKLRESMTQHAEKDAEAAASFKRWTRQKEACDKARECMGILPVTIGGGSDSALPAPAAVIHRQGDGRVIVDALATTGLASTTTGGRPPRAPPSALAATAAALTLPVTGGGTSGGLAAGRLQLRAPTPSEVELWVSVGYACKIIDAVALQGNWTTWSAPLFSRNQCAVAWRAFRPGVEPTEAYEVALAADRDGSRPRSSSAGARGDSADSDDEPVWATTDKERAVGLLVRLSATHRKALRRAAMAAAERPPSLPVFVRAASAEALPTFVHGHEAAVAAVRREVGATDGYPVRLLGGTGVGAELVLQWFCGIDDVGSPAATTATVAAAGAASRKASGDDDDDDASDRYSDDHEDDDGDGAYSDDDDDDDDHDAAPASAFDPRRQQPPYAIVLETCGVSGSADQLSGAWTQVLVDPPEAEGILTSQPATTYIPLAASAQGLGRSSVPPVAQPGLDTFLAASSGSRRRLRGCVRITGLLPNTSYCYRVRAISRAGVSQYAFGVFITAPAPPPPPVLAHPSVAPPSLFTNAADAAEARSLESTPAAGAKSLRVCWDAGVSNRVSMLRLARLFAEAARLTAVGSAGLAASGGSMDVVDAVGAPLHAAEVTALLRCLRKEYGCFAFLASSIADPTHWPVRDSALGSTLGAGSTTSTPSPQSVPLAIRRPCSVLDVLQARSQGTITMTQLVGLFAKQRSASGSRAADGSGAAAGTLVPAAATPSLSTAFATTAGLGTTIAAAATPGATAVTASTPSLPAAALGCRYSLLLCTADSLQQGESSSTGKEQRWREVYLGTRTLRAVAELQPATAYVLRAQVLNADGVASHLGAVAVLHTAFAAPSGLEAAALAPTSITLRWTPAVDPSAAAKRPTVAAAASRSMALPDALGGDGTTADHEAGFSLQRYWGRYDSSGTGSIDHQQLIGLLHDTGVLLDRRDAAVVDDAAGVLTPPLQDVSSPDAFRLHTALAALDPDNTGKISLHRFQHYWRGAVMAVPSADAPGTLKALPSIWYLVEGRRKLTADEAAKVVAASGGSLSAALGDLHGTGALLEGAAAAPAAVLVQGVGDAMVAVGASSPAGDPAWTAWQPLTFAPEPSLAVPGLLPNMGYELRVSVVGRRACSMPCKPLAVFTRALAPFAPVVVAAGSRWVSCRWYPGELACVKYELQAMLVRSLDVVAKEATKLATSARGKPSATAGAAALSAAASMETMRAAITVGRNVPELEARRLMTAKAAPLGTLVAGEAADAAAEACAWRESPSSAEWKSVYVGPRSCATITGLASNTLYRLRVFSIAADGTRSHPSAESQFLTAVRTARTDLTPHNAGDVFTHLVPLFHPAAAYMDGAAAGDGATGVHLPDIVVGDVICATEQVFVDAAPPTVTPFDAPKLVEVPASHPRAILFCARTVAATVISDSASRMVEHADSSGGATTQADAIASRSLGLQVQWCTVGGYSPEINTSTVETALRLAQGAIVYRQASALAALEVYRAPWLDEVGRWSCAEELAATYDE